MNFVSRAQWGARAPRKGNSLSPRPKGVAVHWNGPKMGSRDHSKCAAAVRGIQSFHMHTRGWADIAYSYLVCEHGYVFEGRGLYVGSAANGSTQANLDYYAVMALVGEGDKVTEALLDGIADAVAVCRQRAGNEVCGHRDRFGTECPGDELYRHVKAGRFSGGKATTPSKPASAIPSVGAKPPARPKPAPKVPAFPGLTMRGSRGSAVRQVQQRLKDRGWRIGVDGIFGAGTESIVRQFQREKKLAVDGKVGPATWAALWKASIT